ncbi:MAG: hypothetical protein FD146_2600 [Anaerolineaceae bacterium]|nr:MAG: hypothetical protein FD146_2600 [Anaerolineaceae bacterium]
MKKTLLALLGLGLLFTLTGCTLSLLGTPTPWPTPLVLPTPTVITATPPTVPPSATAAAPTAAATLTLPTVTPGAPPVATTAVVPTTSGGILPGVASGPYAVILVAPADVLNVRAGPGTGSAVTGSLPATATGVMRAGPSSTADGNLWVQIQSPSGWVNSNYLTEYVAPAAFCADAKASALVTNLGNALKSSNGELLATLVSPAHGMTVHLWVHAAGITFDRAHARWMFDSTYAHNWGIHPGSGLEVAGSFHETVLPKLLLVLNAPAPGYTLSCDSVQTGGANYDTSWPALYANVNFYSLYKPGPPGDEMSWRTMLVGVEYVNGQPYVFSLIQLEWEP